QTQAVPGSAFSISPNGGAGIAGTAAAVSYPAANKTQLVLSSAVHHLDTLALTYTKPGSGATLRDTATDSTGNPAGNQAATATLTNPSITNNTTDAAPTTPALVTPANGAQLNSATPSLTATFSDPDPNDTGTVTFQVCSNSTCTAGGDPITTFSSASGIANNTSGTASVPAAANLTDGTYYWRAKNVDSSSTSSAYSATRSFVVDTTPPTMTSATVAADGTTVTVTWSENLDQTQTAGLAAAFSMTPNGGAAIAGTGAVSYPAANKTQFSLSSAVHYRDSLALTYTAPGANPKVRDAATPTGNAAVTGSLANASITNSTSSLAPSTPALVAPADTVRLNTATPTLSATFADPDANDTGKVTFQVCAAASCASPLATFDSTSTSLANGANGSAAIPGGTITADGTYYWRAKNVDSASLSSSYSATRSFVVDTTPPTISSASIDPDGVTVTVTWSENLDTSQAVSGAAFSISRNGGAGIPGTAAAVSYPTQNQTRFTLSSTVHHLDNLSLTYTKPGSGAVVRDTATPTGNAAATASLGNVSISNNTGNQTPNVPALVSPTSGSQLASATPSLTATFSDPDDNDTGTLTFQVCRNATCTAGGDPQQTFSSAAGIANNTNGSASVPASLADGTYYWRAKATDSSSASSGYSTTQSFVVDTTAPTISSASVAADGATVTVTWNEPLDQTQAVAGSAFSVNGIA
ncbi:MAG TPA: SwmB domain-containing protein, partial [Gaiellaceae bacterium]|nr:SwmB domain-containing protein [Gaiellaceae bacterium]